MAKSWQDILYSPLWGHARRKGGGGEGAEDGGGGGGLSVTDTLSIGLRHSSSINKGARERGLESVSVCFYLSQCGSVST